MNTNISEEKNIVTKNVFFSYDEEVDETTGETTSIPVLKNISLEIKQGEFVALIGHNGSGKSSLSKLFNAMELPTGGIVLVEGMNTADDEYKYEIRSRVGMVLQNPDNQIVSTIVEEDVAFGPENLGIEPTEIRARVDKALKTVDMYDFRLHEPHRLSGGQKQRVAIAGILAMEPAYIVLDESTSMLDPSGRKEVLSTIDYLNKEQGMSVILITHNMEEAVLADRIVVLEKGEIVIEGTPKEVFSQGELLRKTELDVPQPTMLCEKLKENGIDIPAGVLTVDECVSAISKAFKN